MAAKEPTQERDLKWVSWNPVTGCTKISDGCYNCYAQRFAGWLQDIGAKKYDDGFAVKLHPQLLEQPLKWKKRRLIFVNSMCDIFHKDIPDEFIERIFEVMGKADWHVFQLLTKRAERLASLSPKLRWSPNVWAGVTVESAKYLYRIDCLRECGAAVKWICCEPLLSALPNMNLEGVDWVLAGGESGPGARPMKETWAIDIMLQCKKRGIPFCFMQWGGEEKEKTGRTLLGKIFDEAPPIPPDPRLKKKKEKPSFL